MSKNNNMEEDNDVVVSIELEDGTELECEILTIYTVGEQDYIALLPPAGKDFEEGEVFLYRFFEEDDLPRIESIEDEEEYEMAADAFDEWLDEAEYEEFYGDED